MFIGHFGAACAAKQVETRPSLGVLFAAAQLPDLVWPMVLLIGWERAAAARVGLGLWRSEVAAIAVEGLLFAGGVWLYVTGTRARDRVGPWATWLLAATLAAIYVANILGPPPPDTRAVAWTGLGLWLFLPWAAWADRHRAPTGMPGTARAVESGA